MKKILYLEHPQADLNAYNIYKGLCEVLGEENIIDFPHKKVYRGEIDLFNASYYSSVRESIKSSTQLPYGIPPFSPGEDIISGWPIKDPSCGEFNPGGYPLVGLSTRDRTYTENDIGNLLRSGEISCIILSTSHRVPTIALARIRDAMGGLGKLPPIIYTDNGERDELNEHWAHVFNPTLIFKCCLTEKYKDFYKKKYGWNIYPLPGSNFLIGTNLKKHFKDDYLSSNNFDKKYDLFYRFMGIDNREKVIDICENYSNENKLINFNNGGIYSEYLKVLAESKIVVTHKGICRETLRYWDIPMFNTIMLCDGTMGAIHPNPFEHEKTAVFYSDSDNEDNIEYEIKDKLNFYLKNETERNRISLAGMEHLRKYHTNRARAEWFLSVLKENKIYV